MKKKKLWWQIPFLIVLIVGTVLIVRGQAKTPYQRNEGLVFGTVYHVAYQHDGDLQPEIEKELKQVDQVFSMFNAHSEVARFNRDGRITMSKTFGEVYQLAADVNRETGGAFDITVAPLVNAWGFGFKHQQMPDRKQVAQLRSHVGMDKLAVRRLAKGQTELVRRDVKTMLDFSAIAKGYGCTAVSRLLRDKGVTNFMVEIGGEVVTSGINEQRLPWRIGVTKPTDDSLSAGGEIQTVLNVTDMAMATSGNYRNFYYKGGKKYAHTIDPKTGYPVQHNILSSTVLAKDCATADAYATAFMVLGLDGARRVLDRHPELMAYFIFDNHGKMDVWYSPSLKKKILD